MTSQVLPDPEEITDDPDLVYDGRARKRPPGASPTVRAIYALLVTHPEGMTVSAIHDALRETWRATDAYRAYEQWLIKQRAYDKSHRINSTEGKRRASVELIPTYGTPKFTEHAQRWWIRSRLGSMKSSRTARREGTGKGAVYFAGERSPREMVNCPVDVHLRPMDIAGSQRYADDYLRREKVKAVLLAALQDRGKKGRVKEATGLAYEAVQAAFDYLSGR